jgi:3-phenylpropionate/trans-cinnamate dioxygenase ferredoxin component
MTDMMELCSRDDLEDGEMKKIVSGSLELLVARINGEFFAVANKCPHMGGDLSQGTLNGAIITCPVHHSQFDVTNGEVIRWTDFTGFKAGISKLFKSPRSLKTFKLEEKDGKVFMNVE